MNKSTHFNLVWLFLVMLMLIGCTEPTSEKLASSATIPTLPNESGTSANIANTITNTVPSPTVTNVSVIIQITPAPLPTTRPDQAALLDQAAEEEVYSVDFVIDTMALENGIVPWRFANGTNWYKFTSPEGEFSVLMLSSIPPEHKSGRKGNIVTSSFATPLTFHSVAYYEEPELTRGNVTAKEFLDAYQFDDTTETIEQRDIKLDGYYGREFIQRINIDRDPKEQFDMRTRIYIVGNKVYRLSVTAWNPDEVFGDNADRFLNSFTLNISTH